MYEPGDTIGEWVVEAPLGRGGAASVYRCHHRQHADRVIAVKVLERPGAQAERRFVREAELLHTLRHPHLVRVDNLRLEPDAAWLEMEWVRGEALTTRLTRGALPEEEARTLFAELVDAVAYLHFRGVQHRDIKPANLVLGPQGVVLVDFGLAFETDRTRITEGPMAFGSVAYVPPEWALPDQLDPARWDLYALGVCLFEMLTGTAAFPPPPGASPQERATRIILAKQDHPGLDPGPAIADDLRALVQALTAPDPARRPDANALRDQTRAWLPAPPVAIEATTVLPIGRALTLIVALVLGGIALTAGGVPGVSPPAGADVAPTVDDPIAADAPVAVDASSDAPLAAVETPPAAEAVRPQRAPLPPRRPTSKGPVTNDAFARWLARHPEWHPEAARQEGRADPDYLAHWEGLVPPPGTGAAALTGINWRAAEAFCASRGGLADLDHAPHTWRESVTQPWIEWRIRHDGTPAWRDSDGARSVKVDRGRTISAAGVRCAQ